MPDKPLTIATYAAGASLAAVALVYVFGPTFFLDDDSSSSSRKKGVVGLSNPANDCFINSVLQALAGLGDLRLYLIRETHRRKLDGPEVYRVDLDDWDQEYDRKGIKPWKVESLQQGVVTQALKEVLDKLNERPIYRKTISAQGFISALEQAFRTRISRQQQDAQEFLQIVAERLCEEYHAGKKARWRERKKGIAVPGPRSLGISTEIAPAPLDDATVDGSGVLVEKEDADSDPKEDLIEEDEEDGFPFEGKLESQIECLTCKFKPKPSTSSFVSLTLHVPQASSTTLNACFDGMLKVEHIDDFKCEYCRLEHAIQYKQRLLSTVYTAEVKMKLEADIQRLEVALQTDPENPPPDIELPDSKLAPKRRIARHMRISSFPKVLAIHLSRSIYSATSYSTKNMAKVQFPESLPLGGLLDRKQYRLLGLVTHKGGHNSGHYESFRRQLYAPPYSTPHSFGAEGAYSVTGSPALSAIHSPALSSTNLGDPPSAARLSPAQSTSSLSSRSSRGSLRDSLRRRKPPTSAPRDANSDGGLQPPPLQQQPAKPRLSSLGKAPGSAADVARFRRKGKARDNRWWRISDETVKESRTGEVLKMQREVYLLFYELDRRVEGED